MTDKEIWSYLRSKGLSEYAVAGIMGNIKAESAMRPNNVEDRSGISDEDYTASVDNGTYTRFTSDAYGYGFCQWTFGTRKRNLLSFAQSRGVSVGDPRMQLDFLVAELQAEYSGLYNTLLKAVTVAEASNAFLLNYERPASTIPAVQAYRAKLGMEFFNAYRDITGAVDDNKAYSGLLTDDTAPAAPAIQLTTETVMHLQAILSTYGYDISTSTDKHGVDGYIGRKTVDALKDFVKKLEALI